MYDWRQFLFGLHAPAPARLKKIFLLLADLQNRDYFRVCRKSWESCGPEGGESHVLRNGLQNSITFSSCWWKQHQCLELNTHALASLCSSLRYTLLPAVALQLLFRTCDNTKTRSLSHWQGDPGLQILYGLKQQVRNSKIKCRIAEKLLRLVPKQQLLLYLLYLVHQLWMETSIRIMRNRRARFQNKVEVSTGICLVSFFGRAAVTWIAGNLWDVASRRWSDVGILGKNVCSFITGMMWQLHILLPKMCDLYEHLKCAMCKSVKVRFPQPAEDLLTFSSFFTSSGCNLDMQRLSCERWSVPCATKDAYATKETNNIRNLLQLSATPISLCQHETRFAPKIHTPLWWHIGVLVWIF